MRIGLTEEEAERLALELARMEEKLYDPGPGPSRDAAGNLERPRRA